jgi:hypothetical protein
MKRRTFRLIVCAYFLLVAAGIICGEFISSVVPPEILKSVPINFPESNIIVILGFCMFGAIILAGIVGVIGLFFFWPPSRYIYLAAVLSGIILEPVMRPWYIHTGWTEIFGGLEGLLSGVIITLVFLGPARNLFERERKPSEFKIVVS